VNRFSEGRPVIERPSVLPTPKCQFSLGITCLTQMKFNMRHNNRLLFALNTDPYLKSLCVCCSLNPPACLKQKELTEREVWWHKHQSVAVDRGSLI